MSQAATGNAHRHHFLPVIAAVGAVLRAHLRSSPEFSHGDDHHLVQQSAFFEITHERRDQMVEQRQQRSKTFRNAAVRRDVVAMSVPRTRSRVVTQVQRDERRARFDKSSRNQCLLTPQMLAVPLANGWIFLLQIECRSRAVRQAADRRPVAGKNSAQPVIHPGRVRPSV